MPFRLAFLALLLAACGSDPATPASDASPPADAAPDAPTLDVAQDAPPDVAQEGPGPVGCTPGRVEACPCPGGAQGAQTCERDGTFGPCSCPDAGADAPLEAAAPDVAPPPDAAPACPAGFADCDGNAANGCEVDTRADTANCGACRNRCPNLWTCARGICGRVCTDASGNATTADCDGNAANGCETMLGTAENCGACGGRCDAPRGCSPIRAGAVVTGHACR